MAENPSIPSIPTDTAGLRLVPVMGVPVLVTGVPVLVTGVPVLVTGVPVLVTKVPFAGDTIGVVDMELEDVWSEGRL